MQKLFFLLLSLFLFSCGGKNKVDLSKTYEGELTYITERISDHINSRDTTVFENFVLVLEKGEFRRYISGEEGCKGEFAVLDQQVFFNYAGECACMCDCNPNIDCGGDLILGSFDIIEFTEAQLILTSFFRNDYGNGLGTYIAEKTIVLDRQ